MAESSASPSKRRGGADGSAQSGAELEGRALDSGEPPGENRTLGEEPRDARPRRGGGDGGAGRAGPRRGECGAAQRQHNEEFWQYNTFQYWRNPLPPIDLADIEDISEDCLLEPTLQDKSGEGTEVDMES